MPPTSESLHNRRLLKECSIKKKNNLIKCHHLEFFLRTSCSQAVGIRMVVVEMCFGYFQISHRENVLNDSWVFLVISWQTISITVSPIYLLLNQFYKTHLDVTKGIRRCFRFISQYPEVIESRGTLVAIIQAEYQEKDHPSYYCR